MKKASDIGSAFFPPEEGGMGMEVATRPSLDPRPLTFVDPRP